MAQSTFEKLQRDTFGGMTLKQVLSSKEGENNIKSGISISLVLTVYIFLVVILFKTNKITAAFTILLFPLVIWAIIAFLF